MRSFLRAASPSRALSPLRCGCCTPTPRCTATPSRRSPSATATAPKPHASSTSRCASSRQWSGCRGGTPSPSAPPPRPAPSTTAARASYSTLRSRRRTPTCGAPTRPSSGCARSRCTTTTSSALLTFRRMPRLQRARWTASVRRRRSPSRWARHGLRRGGRTIGAPATRRATRTSRPLWGPSRCAHAPPRVRAATIGGHGPSRVICRSSKATATATLTPTAREGCAADPTIVEILATGAFSGGHPTALIATTTAAMIRRRPSRRPSSERMARPSRLPWRPSLPCCSVTARARARRRSPSCASRLTSTRASTSTHA
mmetsp:Transcript_32797/g.76558  ORF Transcript_32797/g.76558 Transcript_32797/m.76558 type:complete len:315 (+) Transcript_32797:1153-2097(+)